MSLCFAGDTKIEQHRLYTRCTYGVDIVLVQFYSVGSQIVHHWRHHVGVVVANVMITCKMKAKVECKKYTGATLHEGILSLTYIFQQIQQTKAIHKLVSVQ